MRSYTFSLLFILFSISYLFGFYGERVNINSSQKKEIKRLIRLIDDNICRDIDKVIELGDTAIHKAEKINSFEDLLTIYSKIGLSYENHNQTDSALLYYTQALEYAEHLGDDLKILSIYNNLATTHKQKAEYEKSKSYYDKAMRLALKKGDKVAIQNTYQGLDALYKDTEGFENAAKHYLESIKIVEKRDKEIATLQKQKERQLLIGVAFIGLLILVLGGFILRISKKNLRLRKQNQEIENKNTKLMESNQVLQQFAYVAAHDLKEPLRSIGSFTNLIQRRYGKDMNEEANEYMSYVQTSVKRMDGLLLSLLEYSGVTMQQTASTIVNTQEVLQGVLENLQDSIQAKDAQIEIINPGFVRMKETHLTQLLQNLIANSIKYNNRQPHIQISSHKSGNRVHFTLSDNGIGMNKANGEKVFNLFYQEDKTRREGSGIGLTICKNIIEKYDGDIHYDTREGKGTTFFFDLPAA